MKRMGVPGVGVVRLVSGLSLVATVCTSLLMMIYLYWCLQQGNGVRAVNIVLLAVTAVNLISYLLMRGIESREIKRARRFIKHACKLIKLFMNAVSIAAIVYAIFMTPREVSIFRVILLPATTALWGLQLFLELLSISISGRINSRRSSGVSVL